MENNTHPKTPWEVAYYLYLQQAYKPHTDIPTREELLDRNPGYLVKVKKEKKEAAKGMRKYFLRGYKPKKRKEANLVDMLKKAKPGDLIKVRGGTLFPSAEAIAWAKKVR